MTAVRPGGVPDDGYASFEIEGHYDAVLEGRFDQMIEGTGAQWFWLLFGERGSLCPKSEVFRQTNQDRDPDCQEKEEPKILGLDLAYLSPYWQAFNVWMVLDPSWGWQRKQFQGTDAFAEDYEAKDVSIVDGREVRVWTKLRPTGMDRWQSRHYPAADQTLPVSSGERLVVGAWGHEHCELCNEHIDAGMFGYIDPADRWMCENCYQRYATRRDLAFVDEL